MRKLLYLVLSLFSLSVPLTAQTNPTISITPVANDSVNVIYRWSGLASRTYDLSTFSLPRKSELEVSRIIVGTSFTNTIHKSVLPAGTRLYMAVRSSNAANRTEIVYTPVVAPPVTPPAPPPPPVMPPPAPTPILTLTATPLRITAGATTTIAWTTSNITGTCTVSNGTQTVSGQPLQASYSAPLTTTTTVSVTCGTLTRTVTITVDPVAPPVTPPPPPPVTPPPVTPPVQPSNYPNRPASYTRVLNDYGFDDAFAAGHGPRIGSSGWATSWNNAGTLRRGSVTDAPKSPSYVLEWNFSRAATRPGEGVGNAARNIPNLNRIYVAFWVKHDSNFEWHPISNKLVYLEPGNIILQSRHWQEYFTISIGSIGADQYPQINTNPTGKWVFVEYLVDAPGRSIKVWLDGVLVTNYSGTVPSPWNELKLDSTWGGGGSTKTRDSFRWIDHIFVATTP